MGLSSALYLRPYVSSMVQQMCRTMTQHGSNRVGLFRHLHSDARDYFLNVLGDRGVLTSQDALSSVNVDWTGNFRGAATAVLAPASTAEVSKILSYCNEHYLPVVPMGGNTGLAGGAVARPGEAVVTFARMNKILGFQEV